MYVRNLAATPACGLEVKRDERSRFFFFYFLGVLLSGETPGASLRSSQSGRSSAFSWLVWMFYGRFRDLSTAGDLEELGIPSSRKKDENSVMNVTST